MKAFGLKHQSSPIEFLEVHEPAVSHGQVKVKIQTIGLNPVDYKIAEHPNPDWVYPRVLGADAAGTVVQVGEGVTRFVTGDRVMVHNERSRAGVFAEYYAAPEYFFSHIPAELSFEEAALIPCPGLTAYYLVNNLLALNPGDFILLNGSNGAVGTFVIQLAFLKGVQIIALTSSRHREKVHQLGVHHLIDQEAEEYENEVLRITNAYGVRLAIDLIGSESAERLSTIVAQNGTLACVASAPASNRAAQHIEVVEVSLGRFYRERGLRGFDPATAGELLASLASEKRLQLPSFELIQFDNLVEGLKALRERRNRAKIVVQLTL